MRPRSCTYFLSLGQRGVFELYQKGTDYLKFIKFIDGVPEHAPSVGYCKARYRKPVYRNYLKGFYLVLYFALAVLASTPVVFFAQLSAQSWLLTGSAVVFCLVAFAPLAAWMLRQYSAVL